MRLRAGGGAVRIVPPWVKLAIHDVGFDPDKKQPRGAALAETKNVAHARLQEYLRDMGIDKALFAAASAIPFESRRFLERDDLVRFGIDRRELGETAWWFMDEPKPSMDKRFFARTDSGQPHHLDGLIHLDCGAGRACAATRRRRIVRYGPTRVRYQRERAAHRSAIPDPVA